MTSHINTDKPIIIVGTLAVNGNSETFPIINSGGEKTELRHLLFSKLFFLNKKKVAQLSIKEKNFLSYSLAYDGRFEQYLIFQPNEKKLILAPTINSTEGFDLLKDLDNFFTSLNGKTIVVAINTRSTIKCSSPAMALSINFYWSDKNQTPKLIEDTLRYIDLQMNAMSIN